MMDLDINGNRTLKEAVAEVFETMVFMDIATLKSTDEDFESVPSVMCSISFSGQYEGALTITCSTKCAEIITMNVLALDDESEIETSDIPDAMGEIANMTMGSIKSRLYEKLGELAVSVPVVISGENIKSQLRESDELIRQLITIDGMYPMLLQLVITKKEG